MYTPDSYPITGYNQLKDTLMIIFYITERKRGRREKEIDMNILALSLLSVDTQSINY